MQDSDKILLGNSDDLQIYHNGSNSYIDDAGTGNLYIRGSTTVELGKYTGETFVKCTADGDVKLYYNDSVKLATKSDGVDITGNLTASGNVTAYSDITLKDNIETIPDALDKVSQIRGVTYNRKDLEDKPRHAGVIAQEVEKVLPEVISTDEDGIKSVAYGNLVGLLIESIKELKSEVDELKTKLEG